MLLHREWSHLERGTEISSTASIVFLLSNEGAGITDGEVS
jgi:hypothetical protein